MHELKVTEARVRTPAEKLVLFVVAESRGVQILPPRSQTILEFMCAESESNAIVDLANQITKCGNLIHFQIIRFLLEQRGMAMNAKCLEEIKASMGSETELLEMYGAAVREFNLPTIGQTASEE